MFTKGFIGSEAAGEIKMYLVTSDFHCPRAEFIFRTPPVRLIRSIRYDKVVKPIDIIDYIIIDLYRCLSDTMDLSSSWAIVARVLPTSQLPNFPRTRTVFESEGAGEVDIESCPAFSALKDDISDDPKKDPGRWNVGPERREKGEKWMKGFVTVCDPIATYMDCCWFQRCYSRCEPWCWNIYLHLGHF